MTLKLYLDFLSQPSRALYVLLKYSKCDFESRFVNVFKGQNISREYTAISRFQRVPAINHDGFLQSESVAIIKYLSRENLILESLYPKDRKLQARVDEFLEWQHVGLRAFCSMYFTKKSWEPTRYGETPNPKTIEAYKRRMEEALESFEELWLNNGTEYLVGNTITVADLLAACELEQPSTVFESVLLINFIGVAYPAAVCGQGLADYNAMDKFNGISVWWTKVRNHFNPHYDEAHVLLNKIVDKHIKMEDIIGRHERKITKNN